MIYFLNISYKLILNVNNAIAFYHFYFNGSHSDWLSSVMYFAVPQIKIVSLSFSLQI